jgi:sulfur carrier protein ThiS
VTATLRLMGALRTLAGNSGLGDRATITVEHGQSLESACGEVGVRRDLVALFVVNGRPETGDYVLRAGDDVKLVALVGGG